MAIMGLSKPSRPNILTPEELVRQRLLLCLVEEKGFPKEQLVIEKSLSELLPGISVPFRRVDLVCFAPPSSEGFAPLFAVECKREGCSLEEASEQLIGYNYFLRAPFLAVVSATEAFYWETAQGNLIAGLPFYSELTRL